ncbi:MAG TPA: MBL fold metallo-hydrolase [Candidatus Nanopelagicales bacterium]|nr:MBL fold metallo-hydrolase [Candidatus Nanopelagicales bacterium]
MIPKQEADRLTVHVIGAGFGESQVILLPSGHCVVVDCCMEGGKNLTLDLLQELGAPRIDLLVVTHPDLDHMRGIPGLVRAYPPAEVWRFPFGGLRELVSGWCRLNPRDPRLEEIDEAFRVLEELEEQNVAWEAGMKSTVWSPAPSVEIRCLAPTPCDLRHVRDKLFELVQYSTATGRKEAANDEPTLGNTVRDYLRGEGSLDDRPNLISLALAVRWQDRRLLLCGDVENGRKTVEHSGWKGILHQLEKDQLLGCVEGVDFIKVAHHGSNGAFHVPAWLRHQRADRSTIAAITPFDRGKQPLPRKEVLAGMRAYAGRLGITSDARGAFGVAEEAGWKRDQASSVTTPGPHISVVFAATGAGQLHAGARAGAFRAV